jgi:hypothetical protein
MRVLFGTKLRLKSGQVVGEFFPVLCIQGTRHILHKPVKAQRKFLVSVWWLHINSKKIKILKLEIIETCITSRITKEVAMVHKIVAANIY